MNVSRTGRIRPMVLVGAALGLATALASCGTRVSRADVVAGAGGGPVTVAGARVGPDAGASAAITPDGAATPSASLGPAAPSDLPPSAAGGGATAVGSSGGPVPSGPAVPAIRATSGPPRSAAVGSSAAVPRSGQPCTSQGSPIVYGQVGTFSGIIGASQGSAQAGLKVWAAATNAAGGIACHPVQVVSIDDGGDAGKAQSAVQTLVETDHAVAVNAFVPVTLNGIQSYLDNAKVPVVGGDLLSSQWFQDADFFPQGSTFEAAIYTFLKYGAMKGGHKYSFFYCIEATPCTAAQDYVTKQGLAAKAGLQGVGDQPISLAGSNFTQQCATAKNKGADVVIIGAGATAVTAIGRDCANQGYHPIYITEALAAVNSLAKDPNLDGLTISNTSFPYMLSSTPAEAAFQNAIKQYAPSLDVSGGAAGAWTSGELLKTAILKLGDAAYGALTPSLIIQALHLVKNETLGGLAPGAITFNAGGAATPNRCGFVATVSGRAFVAPIGNQQICEP